MEFNEEVKENLRQLAMELKETFKQVEESNQRLQQAMYESALCKLVGTDIDLLDAYFGLNGMAVHAGFTSLEENIDELKSTLDTKSAKRTGGFWYKKDKDDKLLEVLAVRMDVINPNDIARMQSALERINAGEIREAIRYLHDLKVKILQIEIVYME